MFEPMTPFTPRVHTTDTAVLVPKMDGLREPSDTLLVVHFPPEASAIDFFSDEPLACPIGKVDGEACESCQ